MPKTSPRFRPEDFKDHFAEYESTKIGGVPAEILVFRRKGTVTGYIRFLRIGRELFVSGDHYNASYSWSGPQTLHWMADTDFQYFHSKCSSSPEGVPSQVWDGEYFTETGICEVKMAIENRWDEPADDITDDHPMVKAWRAVNQECGPSDGRELRYFMEREVPRDITDTVPEKYQRCLEGNDVCVAEFFFGAHWYEYIPAGHVASWTCVYHHGALQLAVQRIENITVVGDPPAK